MKNVALLSVLNTIFRLLLRVAYFFSGHPMGGQALQTGPGTLGKSALSAVV